ncbi:MAG: VWA domain-containing protein [Gaiellaceae bacterium]
MTRSLASQIAESRRRSRGNRAERGPLLFVVALLAVAALAAPVAATAGVSLRSVDASAYPTLRLTLVSPAASNRAPTLTENGRKVAGLTAENLASAKSVVVAIDRSRSMAGKKLDDAVAAARDFVAAKAGSDRVAVVVFGSSAVQLTGFSSSTIDADDALRTMAVDSKSGTALFDAVSLSTRLLSKEAGRARVVVLLTDGQDVSSHTSLRDAVAAARKSGVIIYPIGVGASGTTERPLREMASQTGGAFHAAGTSSVLKGVYSSIASELRRTWRLEYVTGALPGDKLHLRVSVGAQGAGSSDFTVPGGPGQTGGGGGGLPSPFYSAFGGLLVTLLVAFLVLAAAGFALQGSRGSWVKGRLAPHVGGGPRRARRREGRERLAAFAGLFRATEKAFGHRTFWQKFHTRLERADVPLRTVEFVYLMLGCGFVLAMFAALTGRSSMGILIALGIGALIPYGWVWFKARKRMTAFEDQLPDLLVTLAASLKAGHSFKQGIQTIVDEGQEPASKELGRVITDTRLGRPMDEALAATAVRIGSENFSFVITAVTIQRQVGGSLAGLFDMVADTVRQRQQFARKIRSLTSMGRASAYVLVGLPFFVAFAITLLNPTYMDPLYHTSTGHMLIFIGLAMMAFGSLLLKKIVSFRG